MEKDKRLIRLRPIKILSESIDSQGEVGVSKYDSVILIEDEGNSKMLTRENTSLHFYDNPIYNYIETVYQAPDVVRIWRLKEDEKLDKLFHFLTNNGFPCIKHESHEDSLAKEVAKFVLQQKIEDIENNNSFR